MSRPTGVFKVRNSYANMLNGYRETPKAVFAAVALSLAMRLCDDDPREAADLIDREWATLHANGVVPQKPRKAVQS